jgi:calcium-dependent protein kinase
VGLKASSEELEELKNLFIRLDTSKDGTLSIEELKEGMEQVTKKIGTQKAMEYEGLMHSLDKDGNGVIDYTEFITGAIDKVALLNIKNL